MKHHKEYQKIFFGCSDIASLTLRGCNLNPVCVTTYSDGSYHAYVIDDDTELGDHFENIGEFNHWLWVYDDTRRVATFDAEKITVYQAGLTFAVRLSGNCQKSKHSDPDMFEGGGKISFTYLDPVTFEEVEGKL